MAVKFIYDKIIIAFYSRHVSHADQVLISKTSLQELYFLKEVFISLRSPIEKS